MTKLVSFGTKAALAGGLMFLVGGIESSSASYDADGALRHTTLIDNSNNEKHVHVRIETKSVTSPMIFERKESGK